jgi:hypothetical protein
MTWHSYRYWSVENKNLSLTQPYEVALNGSVTSNTNTTQCYIILYRSFDITEVLCNVAL